MPGADIALKEMAWIIAGLAAFYFVMDLLVFRKHPKRLDYRGRLLNVLIAAGIFAILAISVKVFTWALLFQIFLMNIVDLCILLLATTGVILIFKTSVTTNFAQGMMATFGAFFAATIVMKLTASSNANPTLNLFIGLISGILVSFLLGLFIDVAIIRRGRYVTSVGKQMITMGLVMVIMGVIPVIFGTNPVVLPAFSIDVKTFSIGSGMYVIPVQSLYAIGITAGVLILLFSMLRFTKWGLGVRATASSEMVAGMMGVNTHVI
ncbi:MAG: hypothetical protein PHP61_04215, partial [Candidatus Izemoplasmatales bacterium]|nr:hypothetical protein [Candidatus Izemoplasmatales bacterium]